MNENLLPCAGILVFRFKIVDFTSLDWQDITQQDLYTHVNTTVLTQKSFNMYVHIHACHVCTYQVYSSLVFK